ncbi:MAG: Auxin Efflux Carrier [Firmicutes bacterium]|nr:Auxin Efflux Carrier [Bacillota bacterium]
MNNINAQFVFSLAIILLGYFLKRLDLLKKEDGEGLSRIIFNITLPALIIVTFSTINIDLSLILVTITGILYGILMALVGGVAFGKEEHDTRGMLSMLIPGVNVGLFAFPLVEAIWGQEGIKYFGMFDVGNSIIVFGVSYIIAGYFSADKAVGLVGALKKSLKSVSLLAYIVSFGVAVVGIHFPKPVIDGLQILGKANTPLSLLLLGMYLSFSFDTAYLKSMVKVLAFRYLIGLAAGAVFFYLLPFEPMVRYTALIAFLLPIPTITISYALEFDYNVQFVGTLTNITILISFFLVWLDSATFLVG